MTKTEIVTVRPSVIMPLLTPMQLAVLVNRTPRQVAAFLRRKGNENLFALPFQVLESFDENKIINWRRSRHPRVMMPFFHTKLGDVGTIVEQILERMAGLTFEVVFDESNCFSVPYRIVPKIKLGQEGT